MKATRLRDTPAELSLRRLLHARGLRYRVDHKLLDGLRRRGDVVFPRLKLAVFVDGCFWHGCPTHGTIPRKTNREWWKAKIEGNKKRDLDTNHRLEAAGWTVLRFWEHESPEVSAKSVIEAVDRLRVD